MVSISAIGNMATKAFSYAKKGVKIVPDIIFGNGADTFVKAANNAQQNTRANETGKSSVQGGIVKQHVKNQQSKKPAEEDNKWYNVFKKVKNYFVD